MNPYVLTVAYKILWCNLKMDRILAIVRSQRGELRLRPRAKLIKELEAKLEELKAKPSGSIPPYVRQMTERAIRDLAEACSEEELTSRAAEWIRAGLTDADKMRRRFMTQLGSFILVADVRMDFPEHEWSSVPNNEINFICDKCGIVGFKLGSEILSPYTCDQFAKLMGRDT